MSVHGVQNGHAAQAGMFPLCEERSFHKCEHALRWTGARSHREFDLSLQLRGSGSRRTIGQCPGDRYFRPKTQARRLEAAGLCLALSVRPYWDRPGFAQLPAASLDQGRSLPLTRVTKQA